MKVVMVEPGQYARIEEMNTGLESLQKAVGGLIDCAYTWQEKVCIVCNDEGLLNGMPLNRNVEDYQPIAGPFFVCGIEGDDFCSLTDEQAERYKAMFLQPELFIPYKNGLMQLKYDNPDLPGAPEKLKQEYESRNNLPMYSFCCATGVDMVMMVEYGKPGYWPIVHFPEGMSTQRYADALNEKIGVSKPQQKAMLNGAVFGWNTSAANPGNYDIDGIPKLRGQRRNNPER